MWHLIVGGLTLSIVFIKVGNSYFPGTNMPAQTEAIQGNDDQATNAVNPKSSAESQRDIDSSLSFDDINWVKVLDKLLFLFLIVLLFYFTLQSYQGGILRFIGGMFPREFKTLGLDKLLAEYSSDSALRKDLGASVVVGNNNQAITTEL